jgi:predicted ATPase
VPDLPRGTVTFLFTDVEGSTRLLDELGPERYAEALAEHRRALRASFAANGGVEVDTQGDAFFVAFSEAPAALAAAADAQATLAQGPIRVRMGLHTGTPLVTPEGYVGADVHKAARIAAVGHGGQVLVSETTRVLVSDELRSLGAHRLKDLAGPEPIWQLGDGEFPPLRSLNWTNLPIQPTPFLGRERELAEVLALMRRPDVRLLTLTGAGGSGKTRLALQSAAEAVEEYANGVFWVPLQAAREPELVVPTIAQIVGARDELDRHVADKTMLLLLDNFEQVADAASDLAELLAECPNLRLLVTSREPLRVAAEQEYAVEPFVDEEAAGFFAARARAINPSFSGNWAVADICRRLDNLPLALELAAARTKVLSVEQLAARLDRRLPLLTGRRRDVPARQRTLRATIEWSYDLLEPQERDDFEKLAVFSGGWTLEAAERVARVTLEGLERLADRSLIRRADDRFAMLETIREFARELFERRVDAGELARTHAEYYLELGTRADEGSAAAEARALREDAAREVDNARAAALWALARSEFVFLMQLSQAWGMFRLQPTEMLDWLEQALRRGASVDDSTRAWALLRAGSICYLLGRYDQSFSLRKQGLALFRQIGDAYGETLALRHLGNVESARTNIHSARSYYDQALERAEASGHRRAYYMALGDRGEFERDHGDRAWAAELLGRAVELAKSDGNIAGAAQALHGLGEVALAAGDLDGAARRYVEALELARSCGDDLTAEYCLAGLAAVAAGNDHVERAGRLWGAMQALEESLGLAVLDYERRRYDAAVEQIEGAEFHAAVRAGREMTLEEAVHLALNP